MQSSRCFCTHTDKMVPCGACMISFMATTSSHSSAFEEGGELGPSLAIPAGGKRRFTFSMPESSGVWGEIGVYRAEGLCGVWPPPPSQ